MQRPSLTGVRRHTIAGNAQRTAPTPVHPERKEKAWLEYGKEDKT
jgi:hypothetical protein